ncbi:MAG TPA: rod shape-determining protein MreC [Chitinophagales bacterium]|nr:rod shape-determining protein MreC [Chitinophagales bacterium]HRK28004.1 rod shape-determining protein MreC [Chitinophagales bacterium]
MRNLLYFLLRYNATITFVLLQLVCWALIIRYNNFQRAAVISSANMVSGTLLDKTVKAKNFLQLRQINDSLINENARLYAQLKSVQEQMLLQEIGANCQPNEVRILPTDSVTGKLSFNCIPAMVINSSTNRANNIITINKGELNGIKPEMGVVSSAGLVGVVDRTSDNFAIIVPIINKGLRVSAKVKRTNFKGSLQWDDLNPLKATLHEVPKHASVQVGDTVLTTGYSDFFPPDTFIGVIDKWTLSEGSNFYTCYVKLATNFTNLKYVYVIDYLSQGEQKQLESKSRK